jgi:hypothetical protein
MKIFDFYWQSDITNNSSSSLRTKQKKIGMNINPLFKDE